MNALRKLSTAPTSATRVCRRRRWNACAAALPGTTSRRSIHTVHTRRELHYPIEDGVGDFLPPNALKTVVDWQDGLLDRLNEQVRGTSHAKSSVLQTIISTAGVQEEVLAYNYACLAVNNSFFLDNLKPPGEEPNVNELSVNLRAVITGQFTDLNALQERFVASASGMVSSGWLWLVTDGQQRLAVIPTFGAGTLLVRSRKFWDLKQNPVARQPKNWLAESSEHAPSSPGIFPPLQDGLSPSSPVSGVRATHPHLNPNAPARPFHSTAHVSMSYGNPSVRDMDGVNASDSSAQRRTAQLVGSKLYPLFCLSLHEHAWMSAGLGVWGKEEYVRRFFKVLNWKRVSETYDMFGTAAYRGSVRV